MATETDIISKLTPIGITGILTFIFGIVLEKFKNRLTVLKYTISFQPLATSSQTDHWGVIDVYHNGRLTKHLNFVTIEVENDSNVDQQALNIDVSCDVQSQFLAYNGFYNEGNNPILLEANHYTYYADVIRRSQEDIQNQTLDPNHVTPQQLGEEITWVQTNKKFHLPVFNRHSKITINLLVENFQGNIPVVNVSVLHKSVKIMKTSDVETEILHVLLWTIGLGLIFFITGLVLLLNHYSTDKTPVILTAGLGLSYSIFGFGVYLLGRFVKRMFF